MINVDFTNIDNAKLIGRLLPFWVRGRKMSLLLQALLSPLISTHNTFKKWALERYIECHITAQKSSLEWYLRYRLKSHFRDENGIFFISHGAADLNSNFPCLYTGKWENQLVWNNATSWNNEANFDSDIDLSATDQTNVFAPAIVETVDYNNEDYERDIRNMISKYMINFDRINVITINT